MTQESLIVDALDETLLNHEIMNDMTQKIISKQQNEKENNVLADDELSKTSAADSAQMKTILDENEKLRDENELNTSTVMQLQGQAENLKYQLENAEEKEIERTSRITTQKSQITHLNLKIISMQVISNYILRASIGIFSQPSI